LFHHLTSAHFHCCRRFIFSPEGSFFRTFLLDEVVKSIDALSREQLVLLVQRLGLSGVRVPVLLPGARRCLLQYVRVMCLHICGCCFSGLTADTASPVSWRFR
jgi:hypothetical protein